MVVSDRLPDADAMFLQFFDRWYSPSARKGRIYSGTRPDMEAFPELIGRSAIDICTLATEPAQIEQAQVDRMVDAASGDWPKFLKVVKPIDIGWVLAFDAYFDEKRVEELIDSALPEQFGNNYLVFACEFGAVLGYLLKQSLPRLEWVAADPYWESALFDPQTGNLIPVFHWAIKKLSSYGIDDGFAAKLHACLKVLEGGTAATD
jgi:hypothetical protein